jgi:hypothetical protein
MSRVACERRILFRTLADWVCRREPAIPFSSATVAFTIALMLATNSSFAATKAAFSFWRIPVASAIATLAAERSSWSCFKPSFVSASVASDSFSSLASWGSFVSASLMLLERSPDPVLQ